MQMQKELSLSFPHTMYNDSALFVESDLYGVQFDLCK